MAEPVAGVVGGGAGQSGQEGLSEDILAEVAKHLGDKFYEAGLLLGVRPYELDAIEANASGNIWQRNMNMLSKWHENGVEAESLCLARVLKNIGLGRLAYEVNNGVLLSPGPTSFIDPSRSDFSLQELVEISREVSTSWDTLGILLEVDQHQRTNIQHKHYSLSMKAFHVLWAWHERGGSDCNRSGLAVALRQIHKGRLASQICPMPL